MKKIALLITLIVSFTYASDGYRASLDMISRLGKCDALEKVNFRAKGNPYFVAAKTHCEKGYINVLGPSLSISITFSPNMDLESIEHSTMNLSKSQYFNGKFFKSSANVLLCDEYGIMEDFNMEISDSEVDSIYRLIRNFGKSEKEDDYEDEEKIAQIMAKYN